MNENAKKWVKALRSGDFSQTQEVLQDKYGYCCLGVACEISKEELGLSPEPGFDCHIPYKDDCFGYNNELYSLPKEVQSWLGLRTPNGELFGEHVSLASLNDKGLTFNEIADIIESKPKGLFQ